MWILIVLGGAAVAAAVLLLVYMRHEAGAPVLETVRPRCGETIRGGGTIRCGEAIRCGGNGREDGAGDTHALRVVQISDIHMGTHACRIETVRPLLAEAAPDVVILTGDYIDKPADVGPFLAFMGELIETVRGVQGGGRGADYGVNGGADAVPVLLCFGNHDNRAFRHTPALRGELEKKLRRLGVLILENRTVGIHRHGKRYDFTGYADISSYRRNTAKARAGMSKDAVYSVGFSHNPDLALTLGPGRPDLFLCGHFHGGQIRLPFHIEYTCLRGEYLSKMGFRRGLYQLNGRLIYISRGLGCVLVPLRLAARPEITLILID